MRVETSQAGIEVVTIHYSDDPEKDAAWALDTKKGYDPAEWAQEFELDEKVRRGEPVFPAFNYNLHCPEKFRTEPFPVFQGSRWVLGVDAGMTINPAALLLQIHPKFNQILVMGEVCADEGETANSFFPKVSYWLGKHYPMLTLGEIIMGADPDINKRNPVDGRTIKRVARDFGFNLRPQTNVWPIRKNVVNWALMDEVSQDERQVDGKTIIRKHPRMVISEFMCPKLVQGYAGAYKLRPLPEGVDAHSEDAVQMDRPVKNHPWSDCIAEGELVTTARGDVPIESVAVGDLVLTRAGFRKVLRAWQKSPASPVVKVVLSDGRSVRCTKDHRVLTESGFRTADELRYGILLVCLPKLSSTGVFDLRDTQNQIAGRTDATTAASQGVGRTGHAGNSCCIDLSGNARLEKSRKGTMSTTETTTRSIILSRILSASWVQFIFQGIARTERLPTRKRRGRRLCGRLLRHLLGISHQKAGRGTLNTQGRLHKIESHGALCASFAGVGLNLPSRGLQDFATQVVSRRGEESPAWTMSRDSASVGKSFRSINTRKPGTALVSVESVTDDGVAAVYDLTVDDKHEFFANGVVVHNCHDANQYGLLIAAKITGKRVGRTMSYMGDDEI